MPTTLEAPSTLAMQDTLLRPQAMQDTLLRPQPLVAYWTDVCALAQIPLAGGVAALVHGEQVAVFRARDGQVFAVANFDPFSKANVISRGIVGSSERAGRVVYKVASPILKHSFDLETGQSFDDPTVFLKVYPVQLRDERVWVGSY
jgi:nitrite reductase (NADH) small subunit